MTTSKDDKWVIQIIETLLKPIEYSGEHRLEQWEKGWGENLDSGSIIPGYFGKHPVIRIDGEFVETPSDFTRSECATFEHQSLVNLEKEVFTKYLKDAKTVMEFGCGTGHNLLTLQKINPGAVLIGLDWATSAVQNVTKLGFNGFHFDMFKPNLDFGKEVNFGSLGTSILTVAALEQLGNKFYEFVNFMLDLKPDICVHLEPIEELMDENNLLDNLQLKYMKKRHYLTGFMTHLKSLEDDGLIEIIEASRNGVGSLFIEGYSTIVWKPKS